jgi:hypothetical protein
VLRGSGAAAGQTGESRAGAARRIARWTPTVPAARSEIPSCRR